MPSNFLEFVLFTSFCLTVSGIVTLSLVSRSLYKRIRKQSDELISLKGLIRSRL